MLNTSFGSAAVFNESYKPCQTDCKRTENKRSNKIKGEHMDRNGKGVMQNKLLKNFLLISATVFCACDHFPGWDLELQHVHCNLCHLF